MLSLSRVILLLVVLLGASAAFGAAPVNDDFANRIVLQGSSVSFTGTLAGATLQEYDLQTLEANGNATVWWSWTASDATPVIIYCNQKLNNNGVAVWYANHEYTDLLSMQPTPNALSLPLRCVAGTCFGTFVPQAGVKYEIVLAGHSQGTFALRLVATNSPIVFEQPVSQTALAGGSVLFFVSAGGVLPLSYQWKHDGSDLAGETGPMLAVTNVSESVVGRYTVLVSNGTGSVSSDAATLAVADASIGPTLKLNLGSNPFSIQVGLAADSGRCYRIDSSSNLLNWSAWTSFPIDQMQSAPALTSVFFAGSNGDLFSLTNDSRMRFFRITPYAPASDECNLNLKKLRLAKQFWARDSKRNSTDTPSDRDFVPYLTGGTKPSCPSGGVYYLNSVGQSPSCTIAGHVLEEPR